MYIDGLPVEKAVDENGYMKTAWRNHFDQFSRQVQTFLSNERYLYPHQPAPNAASSVVSGLNVRSNLGGAYYHATSNNMRVNLIKHDSTGTAKYEFTPQLSHYTTDDRNSIPTTEREGKIVTETGTPLKFYIWVEGAWRTGTLT